MALMAWTPSLSVKIKRFDDQHKKLVDMLNELYEAMKAGTGKDSLGNTIDGLIGYASSHFSDEHRLMIANDYPGTTAHRAEHHRFVKQVLELQQQYRSGQAIQTLEVMMFLKDWLIKHIQGDDKKYGAYLNEKGVS